MEDGGWQPSWINKMAVTSHLSPGYIGKDARGCAEMIIRSHLVTAQMAAKMRATAVA